MTRPPSSGESEKTESTQSHPGQDSGATSPALDLREVSDLIHQAVEKERGYLKFAQDQSDKDRAYFDHLFRRTAWFLGVLLAASSAGVVFFGLHTVSQLREEMRAATSEEVAKTRKEVEASIENEFRTENIRGLVREVAKERTTRELSGAIERSVDAQVALAVRAEGPRIAHAVSEETKRAVDRLSPVIDAHVTAQVEKEVGQEVSQRMAAFDHDLATLSKLADMGARMRLAIRGGLEELSARASGGDTEFERTKAAELLKRIAADYDTMLGQEFLMHFSGQPATVAGVLAPGLLKDPAKPIAPLVTLIRSDQNLNKVALAFVALSKATGQPFTMFDFSAVERWCKGNAPACNP
jgi:hypothetical protein